MPYVGRFKYINTWLDSKTEENLLGPGRLIHHFPQGPLDKDDTIDFVAVPNFGMSKLLQVSHHQSTNSHSPSSTPVVYNANPYRAERFIVYPTPQPNDFILTHAI